MNNVISFPQTETQPCMSCEEGRARLSYIDEQFSYGASDEQKVMLTARVPVWTCEACDLQYTDGSAEDVRHAAICRHIGKLTPMEVLGLREKYQLSQQEWATRTGIGVASVKRWEVGALIQGDIADRYMRLLFDPENLEKAGSVRKDKKSSPADFRFQTHLPDQIDRCADLFILRKA